MHQKRGIGNLQQLDAIDGSYCFYDLFAMFTRNRAYGEVANDVVVADSDYVDRADVAACATNRHCQFAERSGA